ncbi:MAG: magnesium chelatase subunit D, partial [Myxococcota bacterium]
ERMSPATAAVLATALDHGEIALERDGLTGRMATRFGLVLLDEGIDDERISSGLRDRMALQIDLSLVTHADVRAIPVEHSQVSGAWSEVAMDDRILESLCSAALTLGIDSPRACLLALNVARISAQLAGHTHVNDEDANLAARLVLGPRATRLPSEEPSDPPPPSPEPSPEPESEHNDDQASDLLPGPLDDVVLSAAVSGMPAGLLARLTEATRARHAASAGTAGALVSSRSKGRPTGTRRGHPREGGRLNIVETLRAAAPWQRIRKNALKGARVQVRPDDFRITAYKRRTETLTIFVVDASGSAALQRLAEAKGAVEQVLVDCYVRRDHVALIAFRGKEAQLLLPPTRSLVRAKRCLASMAGGGTTPLAAGIEAGLALAQDGRRRAQSPVVVVMTDGRANICRDGQPDRAKATDDALAAAQQIAVFGIPALFVDTGPRPRPDARRVADAMAAEYLHLPFAENRSIAAWVDGRRGDLSS